MSGDEKWVIVDIDDTVADPAHRSYLKPDRESNPTADDWNNYVACCLDDAPIQPVIEVVRSLSRSGYRIAWMTARSEIFRKETQAWLNVHIGLNMRSELHMRRDGDSRPDYEIKGDIWMRNFHFRVREILLVIEDRQQCVDMWRGLGLTCLQPRETI